jgi:hypothetical protein
MSTAKRSTTSAKSGPTIPKGPETKIGPYPGGIGVAIWINEIPIDGGGSRKVRSVTISPRRYFDRQHEEWRDSSSFWPGDLPALIYALQRALDFVSITPIPGQAKEPEEHGDKPAF